MSEMIELIFRVEGSCALRRVSVLLLFSYTDSPVCEFVFSYHAI